MTDASQDPIKKKSEERKSRMLGRLTKKLAAKQGDVEYNADGTLHLAPGLSFDKVADAMGFPDHKDDPDAKKVWEQFEALNSPDPKRQAQAICADPNTPQEVKGMAIKLALAGIEPARVLLKSITITTPAGPCTAKRCHVCKCPSNHRCNWCKTKAVYFCSKACAKKGAKTHACELQKKSE